MLMKAFVTRTIEVEVDDAGIGGLKDAITKFKDGTTLHTTASWKNPLTTPLGAPLPKQPKSILPQPVPRKDWPIWAKALAMIAKPEDKGIGDVVARTIGAENSEAFKKWYKATTGKDCGCTGRQLRWNIEYPLNLKAT